MISSQQKIKMSKKAIWKSQLLSLKIMSLRMMQKMMRWMLLNKKTRKERKQMRKRRTQMRKKRLQNNHWKRQWQTKKWNQLRSKNLNKLAKMCRSLKIHPHRLKPNQSRSRDLPHAPKSLSKGKRRVSNLQWLSNRNRQLRVTCRTLNRFLQRLRAQPLQRSSRPLNQIIQVSLMRIHHSKQINVR